MLDLLRLLLVYLGSLSKPRRSLLADSVLKLRVWPSDLDLNLHLNNARYLNFMDLGRVDLLLAGGLGFWERRGRQPLVALSFCRYFKPLGPFQSFEVHTRLLGLDEKWFYFEQRFMREGRLHALGAVKGLIVDKNGPVPTRDLFGAVGLEPPVSPELPGWMLEWLRCERAAIDHLKSESGTPPGPKP
ncbi:MAG TPA: acyl-CoA thioesterase [bacterium]|nr:acyl-CoA thioesterase [bacterium]